MSEYSQILTESDLVVTDAAKDMRLINDTNGHDSTESDLVVTDAAKDKISRLINDTNGDASAVRIYVSGGGCSGMNYGMTFTENAEAKG